MLRLPRLDKDGLALPAWALPLMLLLLGWGVTQEVRLSRAEDRVLALQAERAHVEADHDRLVAIEAKVQAILDAQRQMLELVRRTDPAGP